MKDKSLIERLKALLGLKEGRSSLTDKLTGTSDAYMTRELERQVDDILNNAEHNLDYFVNHYNDAAEIMKDRQQDFTNRGGRLLSRWLPILLGSMVVDQFTPEYMPDSAAYIGAAVGIDGLFVLHSYFRFRGSVKETTKCLKDLKEFMEEHRGEIEGNGDEDARGLMEEQDRVFIGGNMNQRYHQLQDYHTLTKRVAYNHRRIMYNEDRTNEMESQVLKNRLAIEETQMAVKEGSDRLKLVEDTQVYTPPQRDTTELSLEPDADYFDGELPPVKYLRKEDETKTGPGPGDWEGAR